MQVVVIDSNEDRQHFVLSLQNADFRVIEALGSGDGVKSVLDLSPHLLIVGEEMPPVDGLDLLPLLRSLTESPIMVLGGGGELAIAQALLNGADMYVDRTINLREFLARVWALLRRHGTVRGSSGESLLRC